MKQESKIIYLTGKPGVGKYTIAKELERNYGFVICDNQLINNPIFELLQYDGYANIPEFAWDSIAIIREEIFNFLTKFSKNNYVLTNCLYEDEGDRKLYESVKDMAEKRGSLFVPVQIEISKDEHLKRLTREERRERWKSIDPKHAEDNWQIISITHPNLLKLDVSNLTAVNTAKEVIRHAESLINRK